MLQLKQKQIRLEDFGSKKELLEPNFKSDKLIEQIEVFDDLKEFKKLASNACMDDEREMMKDNLNKEIKRKQWLTRLEHEVALES